MVIIDQEMFSTTFNGGGRNHMYGYKSCIIKGNVYHPPYFNMYVIWIMF